MRVRVRFVVAAVAVAAAGALVVVPLTGHTLVPPVQETVTDTDANAEAEFQERTRVMERLQTLAGVQPPAVAEAIARRGNAYVLSDPETGRPLAAISRDGWLRQGPGGGQGSHRPVSQGEVLRAKCCLRDRAGRGAGLVM